MLLLLAAAALDPALEDYASVAVGRFSSAAQHARDSRYDEVEARIVRIWPERSDGLWLYQEQAIITGASSPDAGRAKPYFQFVARVVPLGGGVFRRDNYRVKEGGRFVGANVATLAETDLAPPSCHNRIERVAAGWYVGRTESCANSYKGAAWMQSLSAASRDSYVNWDRGFDAVGDRVWGPESGGYIFDRVSD